MRVLLIDHLDRGAGAGLVSFPLANSARAVL